MEVKTAPPRPDPRFEPIAWSHGWKVLDWQRGQYVSRLWDTRQQAQRYATRRNRETRRLS